MREGGHQVSEFVVRRLLKQLGYSPQATAKTAEGCQHPDRDVQFHYLNAQVRAGPRSDRADLIDAPGLPERQTHDYLRHGTTTLFAALEVATGKVTDACYPQHRHQEFLKFLKWVATAYPR